ncbi:MAG: hypothetical protein AAFX99_11025 [Myxococcota bacterium]
MIPTLTHALRHHPLLSFVCVACLTFIGCGDSSSSSDGGDGGAGIGGSCASNADCQSGLLCIGTMCTDPSSNTSNSGTDAGMDTGTTGGNMDTGTTGGNMDTGTTGGNMDTGTTGGNMDTGTTGGNMDTGTTGGNMDTGNTTNRPAELTGGVSIFEVKISAGLLFSLNRGNAGAAFVVPGSEEPPLQTIGACDVIQSSTNPTEPFGYDAGTILIEGTSRTVNLTSSEGGGGSFAYSANLSEDNQDIFNPNTSVTITASGGTHIGAFNGSVTTPGEHDMSSPAADARISGDTTVTWSPAQSGLEVIINAVPLDFAFQPIDGPGLNCILPSDSGSFTIPAAAIDALSGPRIALSVIKIANQTVTVGPDTLILNVTYADGNVVTVN